MKLRFSANIGFLWDDLPLPDRIRKAKMAGFDAVECHFPYEHPAEEIRKVLEETELPMLGINTILGPQGHFGLAALPGHETAAKAAIDQALDYATAINARQINVVAGLTNGEEEAETTFRNNLIYASQKAQDVNKTIVIEALNPRAVPSAHISTQKAALNTVKAIGLPNLKIMLDFFHMQIVEGDIEYFIRENIENIGHVQFAAIHDRGEPDTGELNYQYIFSVLEEVGYEGYLGAEYRPRGESVEDGLGWMAVYRA